MKVQRIEVKNIRSIQEIEFDFNGCNAIITGKNGIGKSTFLKFLFERLSRIIDKNPIWNKDEGYYSMVLTSGDEIRLQYEKHKKADNGKEGDNENGVEIKEKLIYITKDGSIQRLTKDIINRLYPSIFDIDKFIELTAKEQLFYLAKTFGITNLEMWIKKIDELKKEREALYREKKKLLGAIEENKTHLNEFSFNPEQLKVLENVKNETIREFEKVNKEANEHNNKLSISIQEINNKIIQIQKEINDLDLEINKLKYEKDYNVSQITNAIQILLKYFNDITLNNLPYETAKNNYIQSIENKLLSLINKKSEYENIMSDYKNGLEEIKNQFIVIEYPKENIEQIENEIKKLLEKKQNYLSIKKVIEDAERQYAEVEDKYQYTDNKIKEIEQEISNAINEKINIPELSYRDYELRYNDKYISKHTMSTSELYSCAIKISSLCLGELKCLSFDISTFDKQTFQNILKFANDNDIQLLVEKPDWEGMEKINIEIIEN